MNHWMSCDTYLANSAVRNNVITATDGSHSYAAIEMAGAANDDVFSGNILIGGQGNGFTQTNNDLRQRLYYRQQHCRDLSGGNGAMRLGQCNWDSQQVYLYANTFAGNAGHGLRLRRKLPKFRFRQQRVCRQRRLGGRLQRRTSPSLDKF